MFEMERQQACQRTWNTLPHIVQIIEYHTLKRLKNALAGTPLYKRVMHRFQIKWIGMNLSQPLLLGIQEGSNFWLCAIFFPRLSPRVRE